MKFRAFVGLVCLLLTVFCAAAAGVDYRPFEMGFRYCPHGPSFDEVEATWEKIHTHGDLVCLQLDGGIPWPEAYAETAYHENLYGSLYWLKTNLRSDEKLYLAVTPLNMARDDLAEYWGESTAMARTGDWATAQFDDPMVILAYSNWCLYLINRFQPDYFNYGVELGLMVHNNPAKWAKLLTLASQVYANIKAVHPDLPTFISWSFLYPQGSDEQNLMDGHFPEILPYTDYVGVSVYPYLIWDIEDPETLPANWLSHAVTLGEGKPIAITETGWIAENLDGADLDRIGTPEYQDAYVARLLQDAQALDVVFVTWLFAIDYDNMWATLSGQAAEQTLLWRDSGLYDGNVSPRPGLTTWNTWFGYPLARFAFTIMPHGGSFNEGDTLSLSVSFTGAVGEGQCQWMKNGEDLDGATGSTFVRTNLVEDDSGEYSVRVTDEANRVYVSSVAVVSVFPEGALPLAGLFGTCAMIAGLALAGGVAVRKARHRC